MLSSKVNSASRLLSETEGAGILPKNEKTFNLLKKKHPEGSSRYDNLLLSGPEELFDEYAFEEMNGALIYKIAREMGWLVQHA